MPNHSMNSGTSAKRRDRHQRAHQRQEEIFHRLEARHQDAERQPDHHGEAEAEQHPVQGVGGVLDHAAVGEHGDKARAMVGIVGSSAGAK